MIVDNGIALIELHNVVNEIPMVFRPTVLWDDQDVILIDTGLPGHFDDIRTSLEKLPIGKLTKIIITHQDYDHLGSLHEIINSFDYKIEIYAHELTLPYIQGDQPIIKKGITIPKTLVNQTISDGQVLPFCGGISVVFTPGHTPDHISLYHHSTKTLITGDALTCFEGQLQYPNEKFTLNMEEAIRSLRKLLDYDIDQAICFHGGVSRENVKERLSILATGNDSLEK